MTIKGENKIVYQDDKILKFIIESSKHGNKEVIIDVEDWDKVKEYRWYLHHLKNKFYVYADKWKNNKKTNFKLHRIILNITDPKIIVDHIFGNTLDNRKENLRESNPSQNCMNKIKPKNNTSGYKGVKWNKLNKKWRVQIQVNKKQIEIGSFDKLDILGAVNAYNNAALQYHGEFTRLNTIQEVVTCQ